MPIQALIFMKTIFPGKYSHKHSLEAAKEVMHGHFEVIEKNGREFYIVRIGLKTSEMLGRTRRKALMPIKAIHLQFLVHEVVVNYRYNAWKYFGLIPLIAAVLKLFTSGINVKIAFIFMWVWMAHYMTKTALRNEIRKFLIQREDLQSEKIDTAYLP